MAFENLPESALSEAKKAGKKINNQINLGNPYAVGAIPPVRGTITSFNNQDYNVIGGDIRNYGIDIAAPSGTPIVAPFHNMRLVAWDQDWVSSRSGKTSSAGFIVLRATLPSGDEIDCRFMHLEPDSVRQFAKEYTGRETKQGSIPVDSQRPIIQQGATIGKIVDIDRYKATNGIDLFMTGPHLDFMISPVKSNKHSALLLRGYDG